MFLVICPRSAYPVHEARTSRQTCLLGHLVQLAKTEIARDGYDADRLAGRKPLPSARSRVRGMIGGPGGRFTPAPVGRAAPDDGPALFRPRQAAPGRTYGAAGEAGLRAGKRAREAEACGPPCADSPSMSREYLAATASHTPGRAPADVRQPGRGHPPACAAHTDGPCPPAVPRPDATHPASPRSAPAHPPGGPGFCPLPPAEPCLQMRGTAPSGRWRTTW